MVFHKASVLGPILFVLYINDLPENIVSNVYMFADDIKIFKTITSPRDQRILQNDLDYLTSWSSKWLLRFHPDKCNLMRVGKTIQQEYAYNMKIDNIAHELGVEEQKDIGVIIDSNLEFDKHINQKINKANSIMAVIRRSFTTLNQHNFVPLYKALVRSHLDYAISIWSPYKQKYKDAIENVQRRATKQLPGMKNISYEEILQRLKLPTLAYRRTRGDMIEVYKLLHGKYDSDVSNIVKLHKDSDTREETRGHRLKLFIERACTNVRKESFSLRVTRLWNDLPEVVVTAPSVNFKNWIQKEFEMKLATESKTNPKAVWKYMNSKTKNREGVSDLNTDPKDPKSRLTDSDREKADVSGNFFQVFLLESQMVISLIFHQ